jgi:hypothetical protein
MNPRTGSDVAAKRKIRAPAGEQGVTPVSELNNNKNFQNYSSPGVTMNLISKC